MAAGTIINLETLSEEVTAMATDNTTVYLGTNKGNLYKYVIATGPLQELTLLGSVPAAILSMCYYNSVLYFSRAGGKFDQATSA